MGFFDDPNDPNANLRNMRETMEQDARDRRAAERDQEAAQQRAYDEQLAAEQRAYQAQLAAERREAQRQGEAEEKAAVSAWRFGPDGHAFRDWKVGAAAFVERFSAREREIATAFREDVAEQVSDLDRAHFTSKQYSPKTSREKKSDIFGTLFACLLGANLFFVVVWWVISWFAPRFSTMLPVMIGVAVVGAVAFVLSAAFRDTAWHQSNKDAHAAGIERRSALFGFDPFDEPDRVPVWHDGDRPPHDFYLGLEHGPSSSLPMKNALPNIKYWQKEPAELHEGHGMPRVAKLLEGWKGTSLV